MSTKEINRLELNEFNYIFPKDLIAQRPLEKRDESRMLLVNKKTGTLKHHMFKDISQILSRKDSLFINQSRVRKARLLGRKETGGKVECFILRRIELSLYECLIKSSAKKDEFCFTIEQKLKGKVIGRSKEDGVFFVDLQSLEKEKGVEDLIEELGKIPLPPYIHRDSDEKDVDRYQTIYAKENGSVAAPTAGLHFSHNVMDELKQKSISIYPVTLHVGLGTFQEIRKENVKEHTMHEEFFCIDLDTAYGVEETKKRGGRCIAVGTTTVRALESAARIFPKEKNGAAFTDLFIYPGVPFLTIDGMLTNFHQPRTSLFVMLSAFVGKELLMEAYEEAIKEKYRLFSYGDCMLVC